jgi:hypothetical protein
MMSASNNHRRDNSLGDELANYIRSLDYFEFHEMEPYDHMGALIIDAVLQAGLGYDSVVVPRVEHVQHHYPEAKTASKFLGLFVQLGPKSMINFSECRKTKTIRALCGLLVAEGVEHVKHLRPWLDKPHTNDRLSAIPGIGPKTLSYFRILGGDRSEVAIDVRLSRFLESAGIQVDCNEHAREIFIEAAGILKIDPAVLDHSVWRYMDGRNIRNTKSDSDRLS